MLGWAFWVIFWGYLYSVWVVCVHFYMHDEETDALHKINDYIYKDTEHKFFGC